MDARYGERLDLNELAATAHVSVRHFSRGFPRTFGETPHQYLISRRIERARHLLRSTDMKVGDICFDVGFSSFGSFTATFRRHVGLTPSDYRKVATRPSEADRIPLCAVKAWARRVPDGAFREDGAPAAD